ncbi:MAG: SRPBCC family protein [Longimicrobiales bacterium]
MIFVETRLDVARPAAEVFAFVSDQTNAPLWQLGLHEVRRITEGPIGVGTEHVFVRHFAGSRIESRNRFVRFDPVELFVEFEIPDGKITGKASYRVEPIGATRCRLISQMHFTVSGTGTPGHSTLVLVLKRDAARDDLTLKHLSETAPAPSRP